MSELHSDPFESQNIYEFRNVELLPAFSLSKKGKQIRHIDDEEA